MQRHFIDYDITEYQLLENKFNQLSQEGFNPVSLSRLSSFKKNDKHYYYYVDFLVKKPSVPKKKAMSDLILTYEKNFFDYVGKIGKFMIFRSENKRHIPLDRKKEIEKQLSIREISCLTYLVLILIPALYIVYYILSKNQISEFLTNGSIILHYGIIILAITFILRPLNKLILAHQYKKEKTKIKSSLLNKIFYTFVTLSICVVSIGCLLDVTGRKNIKVDSQVITLGDIGFPDDLKSYPTYSKANSFIVESYSYVEANDVNAIYSKRYIIHNKKNIQKYFDIFKKEILDQNSISLSDSIYILNIDGQNDSILLKTKQGFVYVTTNVEIYDSQLYLKIIDFYQ